MPVYVPVRNTMPQLIRSTTAVRMAVASVEFTPSMPIFARIDVNAANTADPNAKTNHMLLPPVFLNSTTISCLFQVKEFGIAVREHSVQRPFGGAFSSGALPLPEFRIATNCCSCLRELTPSLS